MQYFGMPFWGATPPMMLPPIHKTYEISTNGPDANHKSLAVIYEDIMPTKPFVPSSTTLSERLNMYQFIRSSILSNVDGKDISMNTTVQVGGAPSLLSFIKFGDLNPYNTYKLSNNVYKGLPEGFLIYRSCYPIREDFGSTICSKDSTSINIRIYKMLEGSFNVNRTNPNNFYKYDEWREVAFYEYIRENIIKKKISPHFPTLYGYFISEKCGIDFDAIEVIKDNKNIMNKEKEPKFIPSTVNGNEYAVAQPINEFINLPDYLNKSAEILATPFNSSSLVGNSLIPTGANQSYQELSEIKEMATPTIYRQTRPENYYSNNKSVSTKNVTNSGFVENNPNLYTGKTLVLLTESPTYNIMAWATKTYEQRGNVRVMINRGVHTCDEWMNVLFQMMAGLYTMQLHGIYIDNFKLENNVLIKDLTLRGAVTNHWKYKINGLDYYLPNLGYMVMIDSNFKDLNNNFITKNESTFGPKIVTNTGKVGGVFLGHNTNLDNNQIRSKIFDMFIAAFDINTFDNDFDNSGGCRPPSEIMKFISDIYCEAENDVDKDIGYYIIKYMTKFLHNRTGTYLREIETLNIRRDDTSRFTTGQLVVHEDNFGTYKFVICLSTHNNGLCQILSKNNPEDEDIIQIDNIPITSLHNYSKSEPVTQIFKSNESNLNEEDLLETYILR